MRGCISRNGVRRMSKRKTKQRIGLAKGEVVGAIQIIVIAFVVAGCIMLLLGNQKIQR